MSLKLTGEWPEMPDEASRGEVNPTDPPAEAASELPALLGGPYRTPDVRVGDTLWCEYRHREMLVEDFSSSPIPWPCFRHSRGFTPILCGDLALAVRQESSKAIQAWWSVPPDRAGNWRRALSVAEFNEGSRQLRRTVTQQLFGPDGGNGSGPNQTRPFAAALQKRRHHDSLIRRDWTPEEEKLLGTMPDARLARQLGCAKGLIWRRRRELAIPVFVPEGRQPQARAAHLLVVDPGRLKLRREEASLNRHDLASLAGINYPHYCALENGEYETFQRETAQRIAVVLDCTIEDIATAPAPAPPRPARPRISRPKGKLPPYVPLRNGPYHAPPVKVGESLFCSVRGREVKVVNWTEAPISWPRTQIGGNLAVIVCGDLEKALWTEPTNAIACAWEVSRSTVLDWRKSLGGSFVEPESRPVSAASSAALQAPVAESTSGLPPMRYGPYLAPDVALGDRLWCDFRRKEVVVQAFSSGPIPWPCIRFGKTLSLILCGDLARAVALESSVVVHVWWDIHISRVVRWRAMLGVVAARDDSPQLRQAVREQFLLAEGEEKVGRERTLAIEAVKEKYRPKDASLHRDWTPEEESLLGTMPDAELAGQLGCSPAQVWRRRRELAISLYMPEGRQLLGPTGPNLLINGVRLTQHRETASLSRTEVAGLAGLNYQHYCALENGKTLILRHHTAARISQALDCAVEDITNGPVPRPPRAPRPVSEPIPRKKPKLPPPIPLRFGPYVAPPVGVGDTLFCSLRGREVAVADWSDGPLPWPRTRIGSRYSLILCGDLENAVQVESRTAIACAWEVSRPTVQVWRVALKGGQNIVFGTPADKKLK